MFNFFDYEVFEALKLYEGERRIMFNCFNTILQELRAPDDEFTGHMLRLGIGQLLSYCRRFYDRQFDTKKAKASELVRQLDSMIDSYLSDDSELPRRFGPPHVAWCSDQFHLSANFYGLDDDIYYKFTYQFDSLGYLTDIYMNVEDEPVEIKIKYN